jgi:hypothetical protein
MSTQAISMSPHLYLSSLPDDLRADFQAALQITGLDGEIALLRVHIAKLNKREPDNLKLILSAVHMIERLVKCGLQIDKQNARHENPGPASHHRRDAANFRTAPSKTPESPVITDTVSVAASPAAASVTGAPLPDQPTPVSAGVAVLENPVVPVVPQPAPAPARAKWSTSAVAKKAPASARFLFHKQKHKKH